MMNKWLNFCAVTKRPTSCLWIAKFWAGRLGGLVPKVATFVSAIEVKRFLPGTHAVGGVSGLNLQVSPNGARSWLLRVRLGERRREIGLGPFPEIGLARARELASLEKEAIRSGIAPIERKEETRSALIAQ